MRGSFRLAALLAAFVVALPGLAAAGKVKVKLGTLAPDGSAWHNLLKELGNRWKAESNGDVELKIFAGGVAGNEGDMVRKMRIGQLQAAAITVIGLHDIDAAPQAVGMPGLCTNEAELAYVMERMAPKLEAKLEAKGFVVLAWGDTGWAQFFFKEPVRTPAEAKGKKLFTWSGDPSSAEGWKLAGFQPVVISSTDMMPSLTTGMLDGYATSPIMSFSARWYEQAKHMPDARWGRLLAATVISKDTWDKIDPAYRETLRATAREIGAKINVEVEKMQVDAIASMKKNGLTVYELTPAQREEWNKLAEQSWPALRGGSVPAEDFDEVKRLRDEFRAGNKK